MNSIFFDLTLKSAMKIRKNFSSIFGHFKTKKTFIDRRVMQNASKMIEL